MKVFLGWSGDVSHQVALVFNEWLPRVIQSVKPFISDEITKGSRWASKIAKELESTNYGIFCLTSENVTSAWIHFEAGALSREIDKGFVTPFLFGLRPAEIEGPLNEFQATINAEKDILKLILSINERQEVESRLTKELLSQSFKMWWPSLENDLSKIRTNPSVSIKRDPGDMLESLVEMTRYLSREIGAQWERQVDDSGKLGKAVMDVMREMERLRGDVNTALLSSIFKPSSGINRVSDLGGRIGDLGGRLSDLAGNPGGGVFSPTASAPAAGAGIYGPEQPEKPTHGDGGE